jgi:hypothetical protein
MNSIEMLAKQLNLFVINFYKEKEILKNNEIINYLKKNKNNIVSIVNKLNYIDKGNYTDIKIYNKDLKSQKELKHKIKNILLNIDNDNQNIIYDLFFKSKQNLLFRYMLNNKQIVNRFGSNIKYEYMLEKYLYNKKYTQNIKYIYLKIEENFMKYEYSLLTKDYKLSNFPKMFISEKLFNDIKNETILEENKQEILEVILDIKNKLYGKVVIFFLHIHMMLKHKMITYDDVKPLLLFIKDNVEISLLCDLNNIIFLENNSIWCYYFIINNILYKDIYKEIFSSEILLKIYSKYKYLQYI